MRVVKVLMFLLLVLASAIVAVGQLGQARRFRNATGERKSFDFGGQSRAYRIHVPDSYNGRLAVPLVFLLHGGGGNAEQASAMGMTPLSDQHGFIVAYPEAINKHWNDGRESKMFVEQDKTIDDVAFLTELVSRLKEEYSIDADRVFTAGPSNGGFMSQRMAMERSEIFSAAGIMIASMGEPLKAKFNPEKPVSMLFMNGTDDPLVPYDGGEVKVNLFPRLNRNQPSRGFAIPTDDAVQLWLDRNQLANKEPDRIELPNKVAGDASTVELKRWTGGELDTCVALYRVIGGGHTVPGAFQYLPESIIGKTNRDIEGMQTLWDFFSKYNRRSTRDANPASE